MALVSCGECGHQVSTSAASCPHCGAPPPPSPSSASLREPLSPAFVVGSLTLLAVVVAVGVIALTPSRDNPPPPAPAAPAAPVAAPGPPDHYYTWHRNGFYGYEFEQTEFAREHGQAPPAITYIFEGKRGGVYRLKQFNGRFIDSISCRLPCDIVHIRNAQVDQDLQLAPQTALWAAVQDMVNGKLEASH